MMTSSWHSLSLTMIDPKHNVIYFTVWVDITKAAEKTRLKTYFMWIFHHLYIFPDLLQNCKMAKESQETENIKLSSYCIPLKWFTFPFHTCTGDPRYTNTCAQSYSLYCMATVFPFVKNAY